jgi:4-amino-4-deoxychorismate lyase
MTVTVAGVLIDGLPASDGLYLDRGLHYGDGLFETLDVRAGRARFLAQHIARLTSGCERLGIACNPGELLTSAAAGLDGDGTLKVIVTRGDAVARGYAPTSRERARVIRCWYPGPRAARAARCDVVRLTQRWGENPALAGMKHLSRLEQVLSRRELGEHADADEGVVLSSTGLVVSGTMCNVFLKLDDRWMTPRVDRCGIAGVMRAVVLRETADAGWPVEEREIAGAELARVTAMFVSNARIGVSPVTRLEGRTLAVPDEVETLRTVTEARDE